MEYAYLVMVPLNGTSEHMELARCESPESACEIIRSLLYGTVSPPASVTIRIIPDD
jgi:hypothetical protein